MAWLGRFKWAMQQARVTPTLQPMASPEDRKAAADRRLQLLRAPTPPWWASSFDEGWDFEQRQRAWKWGARYEYVSCSAVIRESDGICGICGEAVTGRDHAIDHIIPLSGGGAHVRSNLRLVHASCNSFKGQRSWAMRGRKATEDTLLNRVTLAVGDRVVHKLYGPATVTAISQCGSDVHLLFDEVAHSQSWYGADRRYLTKVVTATPPLPGIDEPEQTEMFAALSAAGEEEET